MKNFILFVFILFSFLAKAQTGLPQFEPYISLAIPFNEFAEVDTSKQAYFGIGGELSFPILFDSPLRFGVSFGYYWLGSKDKDLKLKDSSGYDYELNSKVRGAMMPLHLHLRVDAMNYSDFPVLPYIGGFAGGRFFVTNNRISIDYLDGSEPEIDHNRKTSLTTSYGFEGGLHIRVSDYLLIDLRYQRAYGGWAKYLDVSSVKIDGQGVATYSQLETRTDMEFFTIGLTVEFD